MLYEGIKETENTRIQRDDETNDEIEMLYSFGVVLFEHTILESDEQVYSICYFEPGKVYDVVIENKIDKRVEQIISTDKLDTKLQSYYDLTKNESISDENGKTLKCMSHSVEYTL